MRLILPPNIYYSLHLFRNAATTLLKVVLDDSECIGLSLLGHDGWTDGQTFLKILPSTSFFWSRLSPSHGQKSTSKR